MLTVSREALVKIGKHAWNVYPLEAFGFVIGTPYGQNISAVLPCSRTARRGDFSDRWNNIRDNIPPANQVAQAFGLEVVGFYFSTELDSLLSYPIPNFHGDVTPGFLIAYQPVCCPSHSEMTIFRNGSVLVRNEDYLISAGKRESVSINQKRIHHSWLKVFGPVEYSNGNNGG